MNAYLVISNLLAVIDGGARFREKETEHSMERLRKLLNMMRTNTFYVLIFETSGNSEIGRPSKSALRTGIPRL